MKLFLLAFSITLIFFSVFLKSVNNQAILRNCGTGYPYTCLCTYPYAEPFDIEISYLLCKNFDDFKELKVTRKENLKPTALKMSFQPRYPIIVDENLDLSQLNKAYKGSPSIGISNVIEFINIEGIELYNNPVLTFFKNNTHPLDWNTTYSKQVQNLYIHNSSLNFYFKKQILNELNEEQCESSMQDDTYYPFFSSYQNIRLFNVSFSNKICPSIFKSANLNSLHLFDKINLDFMDIKTKFNERNKPKINAFFLRGQNNISLHKYYLNNDIFNGINEFYVEKLEKIENSTFKNLNNLNKLQISALDLGTLISQGTSWMEDLNFNVDFNITSVDLFNPYILYSQNNLIIYFTDEKNEYTYPDKDFCKLHKLPINRLVHPYINSTKILTCSCTLMWLLKNSIYLHYSLINIKSPAIANCLQINMDREKYLEKIKSCDFENRINLCKNDVVIDTDTTNVVIHTDTTIDGQQTINSGYKIYNLKSFSKIFFTFNVIYLFIRFHILG